MVERMPPKRAVAVAPVAEPASVPAVPTQPSASVAPPVPSARSAAPLPAHNAGANRKPVAPRPGAKAAAGAKSDDLIAPDYAR